MRLTALDRSSEIPREEEGGGGGASLKKSKFLKQSMKLNWNYLGGWGCITKNLPW